MNELFISCSMEMGVMLAATSEDDIEGIFYIMSSDVTRFAARRSYRSSAIVFGVGFLLVCGLGAVALALQQGTDFAPYVLGLGAVGYFIATIVAMIPQQISLELEGTRLTSWRGPIEIARTELGSWVVPGIDAATGLAIRVCGEGGSLRIGGEKHDGEGYVLTGPPARSVDCHLAKADFDQLAAALGIQRGEAGPLVVPLVRSSQSLSGVVRMMAPWLLTITILGVGGAVLGNTVVGEQVLQSANGQLAIALVSGGLAVVGIGVMFARGRRVRLPELELRFDDDALIIARGEAVTRAAWSTLTVEKLRYSVSSRAGTYTMPVLSLRSGDARPLRIGAWDTTLAWTDEPAKTWRGPTWIVGAAKWPKLLDALRRHHRL